MDEIRQYIYIYIYKILGRNMLVTFDKRTNLAE